MHHSALKERGRLQQAVIEKAIEWGKPYPSYHSGEDWVGMRDRREEELGDAIEALMEHTEKHGKDAGED